jgi:hypothetical protein
VLMNETMLTVNKKHQRSKTRTKLLQSVVTHPMAMTEMEMTRMISTRECRVAELVAEKTPLGQIKVTLVMH